MQSKQSENLFSVSVVMSVYDQPSHVERTIQSVLAQTGIELEFVIIDDGSNDLVKSVLNKYRLDHRVVVLEQENQGLTQALIKGFGHASYEYIARIDAGDTMSVNRLYLQSQLLINNPDVGLVTSWVKMTTEEGYFLYEIRSSASVFEAAVKNTVAEEIQTPFHSSVMIRKSIYQQAGGYRSEFYFAQDCDLWARMAPYCNFAVVAEHLTTGIFTCSGISGRYFNAQAKLVELVAQGNQLRLNGDLDKDVLIKAYKIRPHTDISCSNENTCDFSTLYFIGRCLSKNRSKFAKQYWQRAINKKPLSILSWGNLMLSLFYRVKQ